MVSAGPTIDGDPSEEFWSQCPNGGQFWDIVAGAQASDQTRFAMAYDEKFIYVAFWATDSQPNLIHAFETTEDSRFAGDNPLTEDHVDVRFDPFNTWTSAGSSTFSVNAIGTKSARLGGGRARKREWQGDWVAKMRRTETGYTAEMAIPWEILNYPQSKNPANWGFNAFRYQHRTKVHSAYSDVGPNFIEERQGIWKGVLPPKPPTPKISFLPYVLGSLEENNDASIKTGLDVRYPITPELTAVGTIMPDFGTIEGAIESIGFTRGERFVAERRPFFLEGAQFIELGAFYHFARLFYPRRITDFDIGAKLYGRVSPVDSIGFLFTSSFTGRHDLVLKHNRQFGTSTNVSGFLSHYDDEDDQNTVSAIRAESRIGKFVPDLFYVSTHGNGEKGDGYQAIAQYDDPPHYWFVSYRRIDDKFRLADGLVSFRGMEGPGLYYSFFQEYRSGPLQKVDFNLDTTLWDDLDGGEFFHSYSLGGEITTRGDDEISLNYTNGSFQGEKDRLTTIGVSRGVSDRTRQYGLEYTFGTAANEDYRFLGPNVSWRFGKRLDLSYSASFEQLLGRQEQQIMTMNYELTPNKAFGGRIVKEDQDWNGYLSYRDSGKKGTEMFVILGDPNAQKFKKVLQVKIVFSF